MNKLDTAEKERLNWDNNFSIRFKLANGKSLVRIPSNIFVIELPDIMATDMDGDEQDKYLKITLRSTQDGTVEKEVYDVLFRTSFDVEVSLSNPNKVDYIYKSCSIEKIEFAPLMNRPKANPFNFIVWSKVSQIIYKGSSEDMKFGASVLNNPYQDDEHTEEEKSEVESEK